MTVVEISIHSWSSENMEDIYIREKINQNLLFLCKKMNKIDGGHVCEWNSDVYTFLILLWIVNYVLNTKRFF